MAVGIIGKILGLRVVGLAGTDEKCKNLIKDLKFDGAINYKTENLDQAIKRECPKGVDIFFDNVGGDILNAALRHINRWARIVICGLISQYNNAPGRGVPIQYHLILFKSASMTGTFVIDHFQNWSKALTEIGQWTDEGKFPLLKTHLEKGIETCVDQLIGLFTGKNEGKSLVEI